MWSTIPSPSLYPINSCSAYHPWSHWIDSSSAIPISPWYLTGQRTMIQWVKYREVHRYNARISIMTYLQTPYLWSCCLLEPSRICGYFSSTWSLPLLLLEGRGEGTGKVPTILPPSSYYFSFIVILLLFHLTNGREDDQRRTDHRWTQITWRGRKREGRLSRITFEPFPPA